MSIKPIFNPLAVSVMETLMMVDEIHSMGERVSLVLRAVVQLRHDAVKTPQDRAQWFRQLLRDIGDGPSGDRRWNSAQKLIRRAVDASGYVLPKGAMVRRPQSGRYEFPVELTDKVVPAAPAAPTADNTTSPAGTSPAAPATRQGTVAASAPDVVAMAAALVAALADNPGTVESIPADIRAALVAALAAQPQPQPQPQPQQLAA